MLQKRKRPGRIFTPCARQSSCRNCFMLTRLYMPAGIPVRLTGHRQAAQIQQRHSWAACCCDSDSGAADHSAHDSGHDIHDSGHHSSSSSWSNRDSTADSSHHHDSIWDIAGMFDTTETGNTGMDYRPSSERYSNAPSQPTNPDFWAHKPVWCQPWSIIASGITFVAGARWITGGSMVATVVAAVPILVWWYLFLVLVPADFRDYTEK